MTSPLPSTGTDAGRARRQQRVDELCGAALRAVSGDRALHLRGGQLYRGESPYPAGAPHLRPELDEDDFASFRGAADGLALRRRYCDLDLHQRLRPDGELAGLVFDLLEQFRVESLAPDAMPGVKANLRHRHGTWSAAFHRSGFTETGSGLLLYTVAQACRARVCGEPVVAATEGLIEATRFALGPAIGEPMSLLRRHRADQGAYARPARAIADWVAAMLAAALPDGGSRGARPGRGWFRLFLDPRPTGGHAGPSSSADRGGGADRTPGYRAFTRAYDRECPAAELVAPERLAGLRQRLDQRVREHPVNVARLAMEVHQVLAAPHADGSEFGQEQGRVDGRRLARLVTSPGERRLFQDERAEWAPDCHVTFLVDCSGSMRRHHERLAVALDVLLRAFDQAGVSSELLAFTTGAWNGGRAARAWRRAGCPPYPGRLNELCHLVLKDADSTWRRSRPGIAALLQEDLYREGVDGEAVAWAWGRLRGHPQRRRVLVVVSDGSPMDSATNLANPAGYLDRHLREMVARVQSCGTDEIVGVGVGLDLGELYAHSTAVDLDAAAVKDVCRSVVALMAQARRR